MLKGRINLEDDAMVKIILIFKDALFKKTPL